MPLADYGLSTEPPMTIEALCAEGAHRAFLYNGCLSLGFLQPDPVSRGQDLLYGAIAKGTYTPTMFPGSTGVIPVKSELPPYAPGP